jgi:hypothetical protein
MTTVNVDSVLIERTLVVGANSEGYKKQKLLIPNAATQGADSVSSVTVTGAGTGYTGIPTVAFTGGGGSGAAASAVMKALAATVVTAQSGAGSYAPANTITLTGGTGTAPVLTVATTQVVSATVAAGGSGGTNGTQTVTGTTGTGTKFQASVTVSGGAITAVLSITVAGNYTVNPTSLTAEPVTGASLTGAQLNVKMGVLTATVSTPGALTALPTAPVAQGSTSGTGTGATFTLTYGVQAVTVTAGGEDYASVPTVAFSGGAGSGATATAVIAGTNDPVTVSLEFSSALPTDDYSISAMASQPCVISYDNKTVNGVDIILTPPSGEALVTGTMDVTIEFTSN